MGIWTGEHQVLPLYVSGLRTPADDHCGVGTWHERPAAQPGEPVLCDLEREVV